MKYFTKAQIEEIRKQLATLGVRDTDLPDVNAPLSGDELVAIVQNGINKKVGVRKLIHDYLPDDIAAGADGASAYDIWKSQPGNANKSVQDFLNSLKGQKGDTGATGATGPQGPAGPAGPKGAKGDSGDGSSYTLPVASSSTLGGIKVGSGLSIDGTGVLSTTGGGGGGETDLSDYVQTKYSAVSSNPGTPSSSPSKWHDTKSNSDVWMAIRFYDGSSWSEWSVIDISRDVPVYATLESFIFTRSNASSVATPTGGSYAQPSNVTASDGNIWSDGVPAGTGTIWMTSRTFATDDAYSDSSWKTPSILADNEYLDYEFSETANPGTRGEPQKATPSSNETNPYWSNTATADTIWMAMREVKNGAYKANSSWMIVKIKGEKGADGTSVTPLGSIFGAFDSVSAAQSYYNSHSELKATDYAVCKDSGSSVYDKLYKFIRSGSSSTYSDETSNVETGDFYLDPDGNMWVWDGDNFVNAGAIRGEQGDPGLSPYLHIKYANYDSVNDEFVFTEGGPGSEDDGEEPGDYIGLYWDYDPDDSDDPDAYIPWKYCKGQDGFGYEYIYYLENTGSAPLLPSTSLNQDGYVPTGGWTDEYVDIGPSNRFSWQAWRKKTNGTWSQWYGTNSGYARLYAHYGMDGTNGTNGTNGVDGKDAVPIRIRNWVDIADVSLSGNNKVFSGFEEWVEGGVTKTAPFRDVIVVSPRDYPDVDDCPFIYGTGTSAQTTPVLLVVNYDPLGHPSGFSGTDSIITLPDSSKFTTSVAPDATTSASYYSQQKYYSVFQNMGALYVQLLVATQAYIGELDVNHLTTYNGSNSSIDIRNGLITIKDASGRVRIVIGQETNDNTPVLKFYDSDGTSSQLGTLLYDLGPNGIRWATDGSTYKRCRFSDRVVLGRLCSIGATVSGVYSGGSAASVINGYYVFTPAGKIPVGGNAVTHYYDFNTLEEGATPWVAVANCWFNEILVKTDKPVRTRPAGSNSEIEVWPLIEESLLAQKPADGWYMDNTGGFLTNYYGTIGSGSGSGSGGDEEEEEQL